MALLDLFRPAPPPPAADALYRSVVAAARDPGWYTAGEVADTLDGRFDTLVLLLSILLRRIDAEGRGAASLSVAVTERFIADMDASLREIGVGDMVVGKHVGRMMGALGGRLGAYRAALEPDAPQSALEEALVRNLYRGAAPSPAALAWVAERARRVAGAVDAQSLADIERGGVKLQ